MKKKKNRFLLFCFSFLPGAGEMYLGFMKTGVSLLGIFAVSVMLTGYTGIGILAFVPFVIWVYGFFHANNLGALSDDAFYRIEDGYLFGISEEGFSSMKDSIAGKYRKAFAVVLIILGVSMLWQSFCRMLRHLVGNDFYYEYIACFTGIVGDDVPKAIIALVIIWLGVKLIQGKKEELDKLDEMKETADFAGSGETAIPVERIGHVEVVENTAENNGNTGI
ncbi:MAG: hypothetical protein NC341_03550 [Blautia sp.]|nr:hypothetical protein [Blautia sp.]MCM1200672.1 hypothetical protein [Bacteroides fragilis]